MQNTLKVRKLREDAHMPERATTGSAGLDLRTPDPVTITAANKPVKVPLGISMEIPPGHYGQLAGRSGVAAAVEHVRAHHGVIDPDYRGEITVVLWARNPVSFEAGDKIAQLVVVPYNPVEPVEVVKELTKTERGEGGFGSTGR